MKKTYLLISDTHYKDGKLTGAHKRFLELVSGLSKTDNVILVTREIPQLDLQNVQRIQIGEKRRKGMPDHISGMIDLISSLYKIKKRIRYDWAISFCPSNTICLKWCGYKNVVSLFREDLIGYQKSLGVSNKKLTYFQWQERTAVKASKKIIVQCENDKNNLISRNYIYDKNVREKVRIQINNANASWMITEGITHLKKQKSNTDILFIGGFSDRRKGHSILLPAISKLIDEGYQIDLYVAGDGVDFQKFKDAYDKYNSIHFLGRVENIPHYLSFVDFVIVPSMIDSCPNTVLEGLNAEVAVYGSNSGGIPDLLEDPDYLFEPNTDSIYSFVKNVIDTKKYLVDSEKQRICKEHLTFDWSLKIKQLIEE